ncbi:ATP-grasp domain-containing protein [Streptomyces sp. NPDC003674]|uniref:ATP-grasp domain-containing protein n=1 Tax=Streptomyces sp. NPDC003273 TaxID=3364678 RepID=UPI00367F20CB
MSSTGPDRPPAFVLFTDLPKAGAYLAAIAGRGLHSLVVTGPPRWPLEQVAVSCVGRAGHPFEAVERLEFLAPDDTAGILTRVSTWAGAYDIKGVFASSETFVEPAALATDLLGLPGVGLRAARVCRNKHLQRLYLREFSPVSVLSTASRDTILDTLDGHYPVICKPLDLYCSIGVRILRDRAALEAHLDSGQRTPTLLEQCVSGREFSVETIVTGGRPVFSEVTQKATNEKEGEFFVEMTHTLPAANVTPDEARRLKEAQETVLARLEFGTGMAHGEYRLLPDGGVALMEIAARPPGDGILHLYHLATGASVEDSVVGAALGEPVLHPRAVRRTRQIYFDHEPGTLGDVTVEAGEECAGADPYWVVEHGLWPTLEPVAAEAPARLGKVLVLKARGAGLEPLTDSFGRAVTALFDAPGPEELERFDSAVREAVRVSVERRAEEPA